MFGLVDKTWLCEPIIDFKERASLTELILRFKQFLVICHRLRDTVLLIIFHQVESWKNDRLKTVRMSKE